MLWLPWQRRSLNEMLILPFVLIFLLFPIGLFSGMPPSCRTCRQKELQLLSSLQLLQHQFCYYAYNDAGMWYLYGILDEFKEQCRSAGSCAGMLLAVHDLLYIMGVFPAVYMEATSAYARITTLACTHAAGVKYSLQCAGVLTGVSAAVCSGGPGAPVFLRSLKTQWCWPHQCAAWQCQTLCPCSAEGQ